MVTWLIFEVVGSIVELLLSLFFQPASSHQQPFTSQNPPLHRDTLGLNSVRIAVRSLPSRLRWLRKNGTQQFTLICQAIVKTDVGIALVLLGHSVLGAVVGTTLGFAAAGIAGIAIFITLLRPLRKKLQKRSALTP